MRSTRLLSLHLVVWCAFLALEAVVPFEAAVGNLGSARVLCLWYALIVAGIAVAVAGRGSAGAANVVSESGVQRQGLERLVLITAMIGICGAVLQLYDKIVIQGIDYSQGIARARYAWAAAGEAREGGVSSPASVIGNLAAPCFVIAAAFLWLGWEQIRTWMRWATIICVCVTLVITSALTGGRSILLVSIAAVIVAGTLRQAGGMAAIPGGGRWWQWMATGVGVLIAFAWFGYVFNERARAGGFTIQFYVDLALPRLLASPTGRYVSIAELPTWIADLLYMMVGIAVYAVHGLYVFASTLSDVEFPGTFLGAYPGALLAKLGVIASRPDPYAYVGLFMPVPGAFYYEGGLSGLVAGAIAHGMFLGVAMRRLSLHRGDYLTLGWVIPVLVFTVLAPLAPAVSLLIFPIATAGFLVAGFAMTKAFGRGGLLFPVVSRQ